jgi:hypothetical protein
MPKDWKEITNDDLLNFDGPQTAEIARYERILRQRTVEALGQVWAGLFDVKKSLHHVGEMFEARMLESERLQRESAVSQGRLQRVTIGLTVVIAIATVVYTWITWQSVQAQREANAIQREALSKSGPNTSPQPAASETKR